MYNCTYGTFKGILDAKTDDQMSKSKMIKSKQKKKVNIYLITMLN